MKLILERWNKFINETNEEMLEEKMKKRVARKVVNQAKQILSKNRFLQRYANDLTMENLVEMGPYVFLRIPDATFEHAKHSHKRESDLPGSKFADSFLTDESLTNLVASLLQKKPKPDEVDSSPYGTKLKWFNVDMGRDIGEDSIVHKSEAAGKSPRNFPFTEPIRNNRGIPSIMSQGLDVYEADENGKFPFDSSGMPDDSKKLSNASEADPEKVYFTHQPVPVVDGPLNPTEKLNLIVSDLGKVGGAEGGRKFISLITMFPGVSEPKAMNKKDYADLGYYFLTGK
tara:strand:+ start:93 stop:950 length:858 start_codon:yes stop_codon:yes gene_type:complete